MSTELTRQSLDILDELVRLSGAEQTEFLEASCAGNEELRRVVESQLDHLRIVTSFEETSADDPPHREGGAEFLPGDVIAGRYRVERILGVGGMGRVYEAEDLDLSIRVALKTIRPTGADQRKLVGRLKQEVLLARTVTSPCVCRVYDVGRHELNGSDAWFITMELLKGETLAERIRSRGPLGIEEATPYVADMATGLGAAHRCGVVHRDFKCGNVMLVPQGGRERAVITDFGIAQFTGREVPQPHGDSATTGGIVGTPAYMAPEQVLGQHVGPAADIYAFGIVLYEIVTGRLPFTGKTPMEAAWRRVSEDPRPARSLAPAIGERWDAVIAKCLRKEPTERFARVEQLLDALMGRGLEFATEPALADTSTIDETLSGADITRTNIPLPITKFVGRSESKAKLARLLEGSRFVTITGFGGTGKTRLALEVARDSLGTFTGGAWLIDLAAIADPDLVAQTVASTLGLKEAPGREWVDLLSEHVASRPCLLVLDNADRLLEPCARLSERLLGASPELRILVTSREALSISGESVFPLSNLGLPPEGMADPRALAETEAVELFVDRARAAHPGFVLSAQNAGDVAEICRRLDGIPLAVELAAVRVRTMTVARIASRLDQRFRLLGGGSRAGVPHHQTLRSLIDWSYEQLPPEDRTVLRHVGAFSGGFSVEAAERVCAAGGVDEWDVLDHLARLADKSLLEVHSSDQNPGVLRYGTLETVRDYASQLLMDSGEWKNAALAHCEFFADLAKEAQSFLLGPEQESWLVQLELELPNFRRALATSRSEPSIHELGLQIAGSLQVFWHLRGYWTEGRSLCEEFLRLCEDSPTPTRAEALKCASLLAAEQGHYQEARQLLEACLAIYKATGDRAGVARAGVGLGDLAIRQHDLAGAKTLIEENLTVFRELGDKRGEARTLMLLGSVALRQGDKARANSWYEESLVVHRDAGDQIGVANVLNGLGNLARDLGDLETAVRRHSESLDMQRELGNRHGQGVVLNNLGVNFALLGKPLEARSHYEESLDILRQLGQQAAVAQVLNNLADVARELAEAERARELYRESLGIRHGLADRAGSANTIVGLTLLASLEEDWSRTAILLVANEAHRKESGVRLTPEDEAQLAEAESRLRSQVSGDEWDRLQAAGKELGFEQLVAYALGAGPEPLPR